MERLLLRNEDGVLLSVELVFGPTDQTELTILIPTIGEYILETGDAPKFFIGRKETDAGQVIEHYYDLVKNFHGETRRGRRTWKKEDVVTISFTQGLQDLLALCYEAINAHDMKVLHNEIGESWDEAPAGTPKH